MSHRRTDNGGPNDRGAWGDLPDLARASFEHFAPDAPSETSLAFRLQKIVAKHPDLAKAAGRAPHHLGTLGTGNHFIELCLDTDGAV